MRRGSVSSVKPWLIDVGHASQGISLYHTHPLVAMERNSASFVFTTDLGLPSKPYVFLIGLTANQYALSSFNASANLVRK